MQSVSLHCKWRFLNARDIFLKWVNSWLPSKTTTQTCLEEFNCNTHFNSLRDLPRQPTIAEGFAEANSVFIVTTTAKILSSWLFPTNIYIQFTIFNTYFSTKLSFTNKRYYLHVLEKCLYVLQEVRSIIYFRHLIHPLSLRSRGNGTNSAFTSYIIVSVKYCDVTFLNNFYFVLSFYHFFICQRQRKIRLVT